MPTDNDLSKDLNKLKRFLSTIFYFSSDISSEIGERSRTLIIALVNNALSVEEFHEKIQSTTNFPLRPFALPFLKSTLPHLQKDLSQLAQQSKQSTSQYLSQHEDLILLPRDLVERSTSPTFESGKRKSSDDKHDNDERKRSNINAHRSFLPTTTRRTFTNYLREYGSENKKSEDEWKNADNMLNYIVDMVAKTKRILFILQQKDHSQRKFIERNNFEWQRRHTELVSQTNDRIVELRRKAEETVLEIKRQSIIDLQQAVTQTEQKSNDLLLHEREQYQRLKAQTYEEAYTLFNRQADGPEQCWHCGRKAIETCSACGCARYCGQYCQHRDWDLHQKICGPDLKRQYVENPHLSRQILQTEIEVSSKDDNDDDDDEKEMSPSVEINDKTDQQIMKTESTS